MIEALFLHDRKRSNIVWTIKDGITLGIFGVLSLLIVSKGYWYVARHYGFMRSLSSFEVRELCTLFSLIAVVAISAPVISRIIVQSQFDSFWDSIEWNVSSQIWPSAFAGAILGVVWMFCLSRTFGGAGRLHGTVLTVALFALSDVITSTLVEEIYFRGILFEAFAGRLGPLISAIIVTVLFDCSHLGNWFYVLPIALLLGATRLYVKSVASCFAMHFSYNLSVMLCLLFWKN